MASQRLPRIVARSVLTTAFLFAWGCGNVTTSVGPNGAHVIRCGNGMSDCVGRADKICGDDGYTIVEGRSIPKMLGGSSSAYRTRSEMAELTILCGWEEELEEEQTRFRLPERTDEPEPVAPAPAAGPAPARLCAPGATQKCVGAGACDGGQVCLPSGEGYGPCDCGDESKASAKPSERGSGLSDGSSRPGNSGGAAKEPPAIPGQAPAPEPLSN